MTILSVFFVVISPKHTRACSSLKQWPRSLQTAQCSLQTARGFQIAWNICMCDSCMFILHASSACILHPVHSHSCICLLGGVACFLGVIAYILLCMRSLLSSSTVMYLVQLSYWCHAEVNFDTSLSLLMFLLYSFCT